MHKEATSIIQSHIAFVIGTFGHGRGGHYWDVKTISESINSFESVIVFNIGCKPSPVLERSNIKVINVPLNFIEAVTVVKKYVVDLNVKTIFCIDIRVSLIPALVSNFTRTPMVLIKPGGPNPSKRYPVTKDFIVYSLENYLYFKNINDFKKTTIHFLPNRSCRVNVNKELVANIRDGRNEIFTFVQIIRITKEYAKNLYQSIDMIRKLNATNNYRVSLNIIGVVQDEKLFKDLCNYSKDQSVSFYTSGEYTNCASELLLSGDAVIANGRSVMEAASLGLPILISAKNTTLPVLLDKDNFERAFKVNFSPRFEVELSRDGEQCHLNHIKKLINDNGYLSEVRSHSLQCYQRYFNVESVVDRYIDISNCQKFTKISVVSLFLMIKAYVYSVAKLWLGN
uniref:Glycosyl transferase family 1 domain-containing protein n=1 Tax=Shewanella putrefaciens (strain 200) TaxID=399804 RepID=E6XG26_SHEP2